MADVTRREALELAVAAGAAAVVAGAPADLAAQEPARGGAAAADTLTYYLCVPPGMTIEEWKDKKKKVGQHLPYKQTETKEYKVVGGDKRLVFREPILHKSVSQFTSGEDVDYLVVNVEKDRVQIIAIYKDQIKKLTTGHTYCCVTNGPVTVCGENACATWNGVTLCCGTQTAD